MRLLGVSWVWQPQAHSFLLSVGSRAVYTLEIDDWLDGTKWEHVLGQVADYITRMKVPQGWNDTIPAGMPKPDHASVIEEDAFREQK